MPELSIIVPVYKVEKYIHQCIDSILNQSFENFEIILVDDGSPDQSGAICDEYAKRDIRVKVIHQENAGLSAARNTGLKHAQGKYVAFVDSDDYIAPNMYELLLNKLREYGADMIKCGYHEFIDKEITYTRKFASSFVYDNTFSKEELLKFSMMDVMYTVVWNAVYTKVLADKISYPEGLINEDNYASPMYLLEAEKVVVISEPLYYYRQNPEGLSKKDGPLKKPLDVVFCYHMLYEKLCERGFKDGWTCDYLRKFISRRVYNAVKANKVKIIIDNSLWKFVLVNARWDRRLKLKIWHWLGRVNVIRIV